LRRTSSFSPIEKHTANKRNIVESFRREMYPALRISIFGVDVFVYAITPVDFLLGRAERKLRPMICKIQNIPLCWTSANLSENSVRSAQLRISHDIYVTNTLQAWNEEEIIVETTL
jgi:hypothetical protein